MNTNIDIVLEKLGDISVYTTVITAVLGGILTYLDKLIVSKSDFKQNIKTNKHQLEEKLIVLLTRIIKPLYSSDVLVTEETHEFSKMIPEYIKESLRISKITNRLDQFYEDVCEYYNYFSYTIILGILLFLISLLIIEIRPYITLISMAIILYQVILVKKIKGLEKKVDEYEKHM